jgi:hypothetical protein
MSEEQKRKYEEFERLVAPLYEWLQNNYCPHDSIVIESGHARIVSDSMGIPLKIKD